MIDLSKLRSLFKPPSDGKIEFEDLVIGEDGTVYGTYWINTAFMDNNPQAPKQLSAFKWNPTNMDLQFLDLHGMRMTAVNSGNRMVGSLNGKAVVWHETNKPADLIAMIPVDEVKGWDLLEATDINDYGQIVGYGKLNGKMHLFLAEPQ
jgi:hypothetical protein